MKHKQIHCQFFYELEFKSRTSIGVEFHEVAWNDLHSYLTWELPRIQNYLGYLYEVEVEDL